MHGIVLIGVMIVTGGAIAFIGDKLGTKIGKKRLSIFGLRPRHTSIIITIITGFLITGLSIGTMAVVSEDVRTALFGMEELNAAIANTKNALEISTKNLFAMQEEYKRAEDELDTAREEITNLKTEQQELEKESERLKEGNRRLESEKEQLLSQNENLSATNENLTNENKNLANTNSELENKNSELAESNINLTANNEKLSKDNAALEEHANNLRDGLIAIREGDIVFRSGEVLASAVIVGNRSEEAVSDDINKLADKASENIAARFGENAGDTSVWIYQPEFQRVVDEIAKSKNEVVVRIAAAGNLVRGEPIRTSLAYYPNEKIYGANEYIFSHDYEVSNENDAESIVREFLTEVNHAAVSKGILPDPISGNVGVMDGTQLYDLINEISKAHGKIRLTARAREAVTSIGPLRLNLKVDKK